MITKVYLYEFYKFCDYPEPRKFLLVKVPHVAVTTGLREIRFFEFHMIQHLDPGITDVGEELSRHKALGTGLMYDHEIDFNS